MKKLIISLSFCFIYIICTNLFLGTSLIGSIITANLLVFVILIGWFPIFIVSLIFNNIK